MEGERFPTVVYNPDVSVNEQLEHVSTWMNTCKPFVFINLGLRVSVQAGWGMASEFLMPDQRVLQYPFMHCMSPEETGKLFDSTQEFEDRVEVEKEMFPVAYATHFEVAVLGEVGDFWFTPDQLKLRVPKGIKECWTEGQTIGRFVPCKGVEIILKRLHNTEKYMAQQTAERQAAVSAQKQEVARIAGLPNHIKGLIANHLQACFERRETELIQSNLDKMAKGAGLSFALGAAEHLS